MLNPIRIYILLCLCLSTLHGFSQVVVEAKLDTADILIGQQVQLQVKATTDKRTHIIFPVYAQEDQITSGVEVVDNGKTDTLKQDGDDRITLIHRYMVTSFDSALYSLRPYVLVGGDTIAARDIVGLKVSTVSVDTAHVERFEGPDGVVEGSFVWTWRLLLLAFLLLLLVGGIFICVVRLSDRRPVTKRVVIPPAVPPHQEAMARIEQLKTARANAQVANKDYYMQLTDALRAYISGRFGINAREMTSGEIISALLHTGDETALRELREIFETADLVKFAKYESSLNETDRSLLQAVDFVNTTKPAATQLPKPVVKIVTPGETQQRNIRRIYWGTGLVLSLLSLSLAVYLIVEIVETFF